MFFIILYTINKLRVFSMNLFSTSKNGFIIPDEMSLNNPLTVPNSKIGRISSSVTVAPLLTK